MAAEPKTYTKRELAADVGEKFRIPQLEMLPIVQCVLDSICAALEKGRRIEFRDFGVFQVAERAARLGRNMKNPESSVPIPPRRVVKFKPGLKMREFCSEN